MKNSNLLKYALLGAVAIVLVVFIARGRAKEEVLVYDSVDACVAAGQQDQATCEAEFAKAEKLHEEVAPRYASENQCYSEYGHNRCYRQRSSSLWLPFMVGYMLAPRGGGAFSQPLYRPSSNPNRFYTARNSPVGAVSAGGQTKVGKSQVSRPPVRTRTVARGGFGSRATAGRGAGG